MSNDTDNFGSFPAEVFTLEQLRIGAVLLHLFGVVYAFVALVLLCREFFVPCVYTVKKRVSILRTSIKTNANIYI